MLGGAPTLTHAASVGSRMAGARRARDIYGYEGGDLSTYIYETLETYWGITNLTTTEHDTILQLAGESSSSVRTCTPWPLALAAVAAGKVPHSFVGTAVERAHPPSGHGFPNDG